MECIDTEIAIDSDSKTKLRKPDLYVVLLHNDDKTTFDFVIALLMGVFHKTHEDASDVALSVHLCEIGAAGVYTKEIAEEKVMEGTALARASGFPLKLTYEKKVL